MPFGLCVYEKFKIPRYILHFWLLEREIWPVSNQPSHFYLISFTNKNDFEVILLWLIALFSFYRFIYMLTTRTCCNYTIAIKVNWWNISSKKWLKKSYDAVCRYFLDIWYTYFKLIVKYENIKKIYTYVKISKKSGYTRIPHNKFPKIFLKVID